MVAVVRTPSACAVRCICSHSSAVHFSREMRARISSSRISAPPPGIESRPASRRRTMVSRTESPETSAMQRISGAEKQCKCILRKARLDGPQQPFVIIDVQIGIQTALHQDPGAAQGDGLLDFFENRFMRQNVAVFRPHGAVEGAEGAILGAEIRVIDIAVDLVGNHARIGFLFAHLVRGHADADQIVGLQELEGLLRCECPLIKR